MMPCRHFTATVAADGVVATSETVNGKLQQRQEEVEELNAVRGGAGNWMGGGWCRGLLCLGYYASGCRMLPVKPAAARVHAHCVETGPSGWPCCAMLPQVRALLAKLQAVFDLPRKLRAAIDQGAFEVAADCYADAAPLLKKYGHKVGAGMLVCECGG